MLLELARVEFLSELALILICGHEFDVVEYFALFIMGLFVLSHFVEVVEDHKAAYVAAGNRLAVVRDLALAVTLVHAHGAASNAMLSKQCR